MYADTDYHKIKSHGTFPNKNALQLVATLCALLVSVDSIVSVIFKHQWAIHHPSISCVHSIPLSPNSSLGFVSLETCCWAFLQHTADKYTQTVCWGSITLSLRRVREWFYRHHRSMTWCQRVRAACTRHYPNAICSGRRGVYFSINPNLISFVILLTEMEMTVEITQAD